LLRSVLYSTVFYCHQEVGQDILEAIVKRYLQVFFVGAEKLTVKKYNYEP
jgi:hypothetical protein